MQTMTRQTGVLSNGYTFNEGSFFERIESMVPSSHDCWLFKGGKTEGYGVVVTKSPTGQHTSTTAHRVMYELETGKTPPRRLRQTCGNRNCTNPRHMEEK